MENEIVKSRSVKSLWYEETISRIASKYNKYLLRFLPKALRVL